MITADPAHPGLYLIDSGLVPDPDHPGLYRITRAGLARDPNHPGLLSIVDPGVFALATVLGATWMAAELQGPPGVRDLNPDPMVSRTRSAVLFMAPVAVLHFNFGLMITGSTTMAVGLAHIPRSWALHPDPIRGTTMVQAQMGTPVDLTPDTVRSRTAIDLLVYLHSTLVHVDLQPDPVAGTTDVRVMDYPDLSRNAPILLGFTGTARLESVEPTKAGEVSLRAVAGIVVTLPEPAVSDGHPSLPWCWTRLAAAATLIEGPAHIHAIADPNPVWDPATSGWTFPPVPVSGGSGGAGDLRWSMETLPDPAGHKGGWYWLGDDGGGGTPAGFHEWPVTPGSSAGPSWHSFYPFRPQVAAYDGYVGAKKIHHPKGLHVNSHYAEHMWLDLGADQQQPFTWIMVAAVNSDPFAGYQHNLLDSGHNPNDVGFGRISAAAVSTERRINDNLPYRTSLSMVGDTGQIATSNDAPLRTKGSPGNHPRMYAAVYNGFATQLGVYDTFGKYLTKGSVASGAAYNHRFIVMGREQGWISQRHASNIMVFEIRYWHRALTPADLDAQYAQLSSTHQFDAYKRL